MTLTPEMICEIQMSLGLSDNKMAKALGVSRQTWRNWRRGCKCPQLAVAQAIHAHPGARRQVRRLAKKKPALGRVKGVSHPKEQEW